jgi:hypothetical protein
MLLAFTVLAITQVTDVVSTIMCIKRGGKELNPLMARLIDKFGLIPAAVGTKLIFLAALWFIFPLLFSIEGIRFIFFFMSGIFAMVSGWNFWLCHKLKMQGK